ncbi:MAG: metallophosphoesterase family protein [Promethearchaeota archaeon]
MPEDQNIYDRILIISDVHGLIKELKEFLENMNKKYKIAYVVHLGDFFKGRNVIENQKVFTFWKDTDFLKEKLPIPIYSILGNEDLNIPKEWWEKSGIILLPDKKEFIMDDFNVIPVNYFEEDKEFNSSMGIKKLIRIHSLKHKQKYFSIFDYKPFKDQEETPVHNILTDKAQIDFIMAHAPPFGLLDKTRDAITHREIKFTGNKFTRLLVDKRRPKVVFFGHNHFANYSVFGKMLVISVDKFCRKYINWDNTNSDNKYNGTVPIMVEKNTFSYCLITKKPEMYVIEMFRRDKSVLKYDLLNQKIVFSKL